MDDGKFSAKSLQERRDFGYRIAAVLMKDEINKAFLQVCDIIAGEINGIRVTYRKHCMRQLAHFLFEPILRWADKYMDDKSWKGWLSYNILSKVLKDRLTLVSKIPMLIEMLAYLHVSDNYSPNVYFSMNEDECLKVSLDFLNLYYVQLHHNM